MKKFLQSALAVFTYLPCKIMNSVDQHPSGAQIRTHVARQEVHVTETDDGIAAHLCLAGGDKVTITSNKDNGVAIKIDQDALDMREGYITGVKDGVKLMATEVATVTRTMIRNDTKILRDIAAIEAAKEAESAVGMPPGTTAPVGAA